MKVKDEYQNEIEYNEALIRMMDCVVTTLYSCIYKKCKVTKKSLAVMNTMLRCIEISSRFDNHTIVIVD